MVLPRPPVRRIDVGTLNTGLLVRLMVRLHVREGLPSGPRTGCTLQSRLAKRNQGPTGLCPSKLGTQRDERYSVLWSNLPVPTLCTTCQKESVSGNQTTQSRLGNPPNLATTPPKYAYGAYLSRARLVQCSVSHIPHRHILFYLPLLTGQPLVDTPGLSLPPDLSFSTYSKTKQQGAPQELLLHSAGRSSVSYKAHELQDGGPTASLKHYIGIYNPEKNDIRLIEARKMLVRRGLPSEDPQARESPENQKAVSLLRLGKSHEPY